MCFPCDPNLLHVLVSRIPGYHNLCSPGHMMTKKTYQRETSFWFCSFLLFFLMSWVLGLKKLWEGYFESFCTNFSFLSFLCKQSANLCSWPKTDKEPRQAMSRTTSNLRLNQKLKAQIKRFQHFLIGPHYFSIQWPVCKSSPHHRWRHRASFPCFWTVVLVGNDYLRPRGYKLCHDDIGHKSIRFAPPRILGNDLFTFLKQTLF